MKKYFSLTLVLLGFLSVSAQEQELSEVTLNQRLYAFAMRYNDAAVAKQALYQQLAAQPQNDSILYNLALLYFDARQYASNVMVCLDLLKINPQNAGALEMSAISYENLGLPEKSLRAYEQLYLFNSNIEVLYKMAFMQYNLQKHNQSSTNIDILLSKPEIDELMLLFQIEDGTQKEFPMRVAILNLQGLVTQEMGDVDGARKYFVEALAIAPDFLFASENLAAMK